MDAAASQSRETRTPTAHAAPLADLACPRMPVASLREHLLQVLRILQDQARSADTKAAAIAAVTSALVGWMLLGGQDQALLRFFSWRNALLGPALAAAATADILAILVLLPRSWSPRSQGSVFFGDICRHVDPAGFWAHLEAQDEIALTRQLGDEVHVVARIVARKYGLVRWAGWLALAAGVLASTAVVAARI